MYGVEPLLESLPCCDEAAENYVDRPVNRLNVDRSCNMLFEVVFMELGNFYKLELASLIAKQARVARAAQAIFNRMENVAKK